MSIDDLGSIGEFLGSIAVLISLVYLAVQIRSSTEASRTSTYQSVVSDFGSLNQIMSSTPDLSLLFVNAMEDFDSLEDDVWVGWKRLMLTYYSRPGFQAWWTIRRDVFSASFVDFLHYEKLDKPVASYYEVVQPRGAT